MKFIAMIGAFFLLCSSVAFACPDIGGVYRMTETLLVKYEQKGCQTLTRTLGEILPNGKPVFFSPSKVFPMNGTSVCNKHGTCERVSSDASAVILQLDHNGTIGAGEHGICIWSAVQFSKNSEGHLQGLYSVRSCSDDYEGVVVKIFKLAP